MTRATPMTRCPGCGLLFAVSLGHECARRIRDVNAEGLGDRRGVAVERLDVARYRPGTDPLERIGSRELWRVYVDGRPRLTTDRRDEAHGVAALIEGSARP